MISSTCSRALCQWKSSNIIKRCTWEQSVWSVEFSDKNWALWWTKCHVHTSEVTLETIGYHGDFHLVVISLTVIGQLGSQLLLSHSLWLDNWGLSYPCLTHCDWTTGVSVTPVSLTVIGQLGSQIPLSHSLWLDNWGLRYHCLTVIGQLGSQICLSHSLWLDKWGLSYSCLTHCDWTAGVSDTPALLTVVGQLGSQILLPHSLWLDNWGLRYPCLTHCDWTTGVSDMPVSLTVIGQLGSQIPLSHSLWLVWRLHQQCCVTMVISLSLVTCFNWVSEERQDFP